MASLMKDVAARAGVSLSTVSHVLSGSQRLAISEETQKRVLAAALELNYHPNPHARNLARRVGDSFGLIISEIANPFFPEIIQSFESAAMARGFEILLCNTEYDPARAKAAVAKMSNNKVRGVAVLTSKFEPELVRQLTAQRIAVAAINPSLARPGVSTIGFDFTEGLNEAVDHLLDLGHSKLAVVTGPNDIPSARRYAETAIRVLQEHGVSLDKVITCNYRHDGGMEAIHTLLAEPQFPTAILCANDLIALGAISVLEQVGVSVPEDVSVVGFDDIVFARLARPPLTTVAIPRADIGRLAFETLDRMQRSKRPRGRTSILATHLVIRHSTAPPPATNVGARLKGA